MMGESDCSSHLRTGVCVCSGGGSGEEFRGCSLRCLQVLYVECSILSLRMCKVSVNVKQN